MRKNETEKRVLVRRKRAGAELVHNHVKDTIIEEHLAECASIESPGPGQREDDV